MQARDFVFLVTSALLTIGGSMIARAEERISNMNYYAAFYDGYPKLFTTLLAGAFENRR